MCAWVPFATSLSSCPARAVSMGGCRGCHLSWPCARVSASSNPNPLRIVSSSQNCTRLRTKTKGVGKSSVAALLSTVMALDGKQVRALCTLLAPPPTTLALTAHSPPHFRTVTMHPYVNACTNCAGRTAGPRHLRSKPARAHGLQGAAGCGFRLRLDSPQVRSRNLRGLLMFLLLICVLTCASWHDFILPPTLSPQPFVWPRSPEGVKCMSVGSLLASDRDAYVCPLTFALSTKFGPSCRVLSVSAPFCCLQ